MNYLDIIIAVLLVVFGIGGWRKGIIIEAATLLGLGLGLYGAFHFSDFTADKLVQYVEIDPKYLHLISFVVTFIVVALVVNLLIYGNAFVEIVRVGRKIVELNLIPSKYVTIRTASDGTVSYLVTYNGGERRIEFGDGQLMHIAGKSFNGREGLSPVDKCMQSIVLARALEHFGVARRQ